MAKTIRSKPKTANVSIKRGGQRNKLTRGIYLTGSILLIILFLLLLYNFGVFAKPKEKQLFLISDECSLVMGNIIHNIKDSGDCLVRCRNECGLRNIEFQYSEFEEKNNSCHSCNCYCK